MPRHTFLSAFSLVLVTLTARTAMSLPAPAAEGSRPLEGTYWRATELAGKPIAKQEPTREAHLQFQAGRVSGSDGCNRLTGSYQLDGDHVTFSQMALTQMACLHSSGTEGAFQDALKNASRLIVTGDRLELLDAAGTRLATFVAGSQPSAQTPSSGLAGTSWQLVKARIDCHRGRGTW